MTTKETGKGEDGNVSSACAKDDNKKATTTPNAKASALAVLL
jgi:hypothetical protein